MVTNNHVIEDAEKFTISLADNREYKASLIGTDPSTDLALLKIAAEDLPFCAFGNSDSLMVGAWVIAVGMTFQDAFALAAVKYVLKVIIAAIDTIFIYWVKNWTIKDE